jgi:hypothetical protein
VAPTADEGRTSAATQEGGLGGRCWTGVVARARAPAFSRARTRIERVPAFGRGSGSQGRVKPPGPTRAGAWLAPLLPDPQPLADSCDKAGHWVSLRLPVDRRKERLGGAPREPRKNSRTETGSTPQSENFAVETECERPLSCCPVRHGFLSLLLLPNQSDSELPCKGRGFESLHPLASSEIPAAQAVCQESGGYPSRSCCSSPGVGQVEEARSSASHPAVSTPAS